MNIFGRLLVFVAMIALVGCAGHRASAPMTEAAVDVVSACEQAVYYPQGDEDAQASLACADVLDVWQ